MHLWEPCLSSKGKSHDPSRDAALTVQMEAFNKSMSNVRTSVEWLFGDIVEYFKFMDFKKNLKLGLSSIGKFMYVPC